ncbi:MAG: PatB family C-S lyase [Verrucomicrobiales bacterium]|nr:PatB family C-S lyase [Verrucomicrobiales bacterium]
MWWDCIEQAENIIYIAVMQSGFSPFTFSGIPALSRMSFDDVILRRGTGSIKWDLRPELDPYWVADMDFASPPAVIEALQKRVAHGVFGYPIPHKGLREAILNYLSSRFQFKTKVDWIVHLGGLVPALSLAARAFGEPGDELLTCTPVYPPFVSVARDAGMKTVTVDHVMSGGRWTFDWEGLEQAATAKTKIFLLCNPQNPLGRCFTGEEITRIAEFCQAKGILLVSDEVHCDLVLDEEKTPFFSALHLSEELRQNTIVLLSPSKTYNVAGLGYAYAVIENSSIRGKFKSARGHTMPEINCLAYYAAEAAYRDGESWRQDLLSYLRKNRDVISEFVATEMQGKIVIPDIEATYLAWMDCSSFAFENPAGHLEKAGLFVSDGSYFRAKKHIRFNFGCAQSRVLEGLGKIKSGLLNY